MRLAPVVRRDRTLVRGFVRLGERKLRSPAANRCCARAADLVRALVAIDGIEDLA
jgi:hypothetical protein